MYPALVLRKKQIKYHMRLKASESAGYKGAAPQKDPSRNGSVCYCCQVILGGEMDMMATSEDYEEQRRRLTNANLLTIVYQTYGHMDFVSRDGSCTHLLCTAWGA